MLAKLNSNEARKEAQHNAELALAVSSRATVPQLSGTLRPDADADKTDNLPMISNYKQAAVVTPDAAVKHSPVMLFSGAMAVSNTKTTAAAPVSPPRAKWSPHVGALRASSPSSPPRGTEAPPKKRHSAWPARGNQDNAQRTEPSVQAPSTAESPLRVVSLATQAAATRSLHKHEPESESSEQRGGEVRG